MDSIATTAAPPRFEIVEKVIKETRVEKKLPKTSLERLIDNSEHIADIFLSRKKLRKLRFDELELLREIRELVEANPNKFEKLKQPGEFRREIRATILPKFIQNDFVKDAEEKLLGELLNSNQPSDQDSLMTALVFLQSHTDLGLPLEDNPLWETIFNLSLKDGLQFVDTLTVLMEGMDNLRVEDPEILTQDPLILQKTKQICQWPIFWRLLIDHKEILPFEGLISTILRGKIMVELYFDELVHLPYSLYQLFKDDLKNPDFITELVPDGDKEKLAKKLSSAILDSVEKDLPFLLPDIIRRIEKLLKKQKKTEFKEQLQQALETLRSEDKLANNIFIIMLIAAKISMKKYWESKRDRFFFFTILKNPLDSKNYFDYGHILIRLKKEKIAKQLFKCAIEIEPEKFWGYWGLGDLLSKNNKMEEAKKYLNTAIKNAQKLEIQMPKKYHRELFLIKEDLKKLNKKKMKLQAKQQPQIDLFGAS
jgi:tetratricopeptide (TPR) repeat protein